MLIPDLKKHFELTEYLGIPMYIGRRDYLFASKLVALTERKVPAMRDVYDVWFFAQNNWSINTEVVEIRTGHSIQEHIADCVVLVESIKDSQMLRGLAELLGDDAAKNWVKTKLRQDVVFLLQNYKSALS